MTTHDYPEIQPEDIREGDLIRSERGSEMAASYLAVEYVAKRNGHTSGRSTHYLIDRPAPPVALPTEPTLGWATGKTRNGSELTNLVGYWATGALGELLNRTEWTYPKPDGPAHLEAKSVAAFVPATAVPTEALDELRKSEATAPVGSEAGFRRLRAVEAFLAAVDEVQP